MASTKSLVGVKTGLRLWVLVAALAFAVVPLAPSSAGAPPSTTTYGATMYALMTENFSPDFGPLPQTSVEVVEAGTMSHIRTVPLGQRDVASLAVSPDEQTLYVVDRSVGVAVLNSSDGSIVTTVPVSDPRDSVLSADGSTLYVSAGQSIVEIDTVTNTIADTFLTGTDTTLGIALSPDGAVLGAVSTNAALYIAAPADLQGAQRIPITGAGCSVYPNDVTFTNTGRALLWDNNCDRLYQVDVPGQAQVAADTISVGADFGGSFNYNNAVSYSAASGRAYAHKESEELAVMDPAAVNSSLIGGFSGIPFVPTLTPNGKDLLVTVIHRFSGGGADTVDRLNTATGIFTRDVYTFTLATQSVRDMRIIGPVAPVQGDVDCSGGVNSIDALKILRSSAGLSATQTEPCPGIGQLTPKFGDVDCSDAVNSIDALKLLRNNAGLVVSQTEPCPDIGAALP